MARKNAGIAVMTVAAILLIAVLFAFNPAKYGFYPKCLFKMLTGFHCPGCGTGRAAHMLLHADFADAFRMNPLLFAAIPFIALLLLKPSVGRKKAVPIAVFVVVMVYWILRNIPHHPFDLLAPR